MGRNEIKNAGCTRNGNIVTVRLECVSMQAAEATFSAIATAIRAGEVRLDVPSAARSSSEAAQ